jgi:translation initiation factor IF-1
MLMMFFIAGCSSEDKVVPRQSATSPAAVEKTTRNKVMIYPDNATARSVITLSADASMLANAKIDWYINGNIAEPAGTPRFTSSALLKGDIIQATITRNKKEYYSNEIRITNTPPRIKRAQMSPALPRIGDTIIIEPDSYDVDGDTIYYKYKWNLNGKFVTDQHFLNTSFKRDDMIVVEITPYDSDDTGNTIFVKNKIFNSPPVVTGNSPSFDGKTYTYYLDASDPDGDVLSYKILEGPEEMSIDSSGMIIWELQPEDAGRNEFKVLINDNNGSELIVPITASIGFK